MEIVQNKAAYNKRQFELLREIVLVTKKRLEQAGVTKEDSRELTGNIVFSISALLDASRVLKTGDDLFVPVLVFADDNDRNKLMAEPGGSWLHEYVIGLVDDIFDDDVA